MHPLKTQRNLIRVFNGNSMGSQGSNISSDYADAQTDLNLCCTHMPTRSLCWITNILQHRFRLAKKSYWFNQANMILYNICIIQWHSQNPEKVTHTKGRLLDKAMILFNCVLSKMGTSLTVKNLLPEGEFLIVRT